MRIWDTDKVGTEIELDVQEKKRLRRVAKFLVRLARHTGGEEEKAAAEAIAPVADKWAPEAPAKQKTEEKTDAKK